MSPVNCSVQVEIIGLLKYDHFEILLSAQCNEDNYCSFWSYQEHMDTAEKRCFLMQVKLFNTQTTSDENECLKSSQCVCLIVVIGKAKKGKIILQRRGISSCSRTHYIQQHKQSLMPCFNAVL